MKKSVLLLGIALTVSLTSCEWDSSPEPEHPLYVTYTISAGESAFSGPDQLLIDMQAWIKANQIVYDRSVNYSTGDKSEFTETDAEAITKFEEFLPKFKTYLEEIKSKIASGTYGNGVTVDATFFVFASRGQGNDKDLKYETVKLVYPDSNVQ